MKVYGKHWREGNDLLEDNFSNEVRVSNKQRAVIPSREVSDIRFIDLADGMKMRQLSSSFCSQFAFYERKF